MPRLAADGPRGVDRGGRVLARRVGPADGRRRRGGRPAGERVVPGRAGPGGPGTIEHLVGYVAFFALALGLADELVRLRLLWRRRRERFTLGPVFAAGLVAFLLWVGWARSPSTRTHLPVHVLVALAGDGRGGGRWSARGPLPPPPQPNTPAGVRLNSAVTGPASPSLLGKGVRGLGYTPPADLPPALT